MRLGVLERREDWRERSIELRNGELGRGLLMVKMEEPDAGFGGAAYGYG